MADSAQGRVRLVEQVGSPRVKVLYAGGTVDFAERI